MDYRQTAYEVMRLFLTDFTEEELKTCISRAYDSKFDTEEIASLHQAGDHTWFLELFHGQTIAFKDMALSILPHLMTTAAKKNQSDERDRDPDGDFRGYRQGGSGRFCGCAGNKDHRSFIRRTA